MLIKIMSRSKIESIRGKVRHRQYDMSAHAMEEMVEDYLNIGDVEQAILNGHIVKIERGDPRGTKYIINGIGIDGFTPIGIVGRFTNNGRYLIITVYEITLLED